MGKNQDPGLLRHRGGRYYGRFCLGGKTKFVLLNCTLLEIARTRFAEEKAKVERTRKAARSNDGGTATMADPLELYRAGIMAMRTLRRPFARSATLITSPRLGRGFVNGARDEARYVPHKTR